MYEGIARNKSQISATAGGMIGEANRQANRSKVYYGLPKEPGKTQPVPFSNDIESCYISLIKNIGLFNVFTY